jgi:hypothetical protein
MRVQADHRVRAHLAGVLLPALVLAGLLVAVRITPIRDSDFHVEGWRAYAPLLAGDLRAFWSAVPGYAGFAVLVGAPSALLADALSLGESGAFVLTALPGAGLLAFIAAMLGARSRAGGARGWWLVVALGTGGPIAWWALHYGHPEDLLAAAAAVLAVWAAIEGRPTAACCLIALAILAKQWAVLAVLPAAAVAPRGSVRIVVIGGAVAIFVTAAALLLHPTAGAALLETGAKFHTRQLWWPLGDPNPGGVPGILDGERLGPSWLASLAHPLIAALGLPLTALWLWRRPAAVRDREDVWILLALLFLLRCVLDPWNVPYYHLPLILALLAWEVRQGRRWPLATVLVTGMVTLTFFGWEFSQGIGPYLLYMAWALTLGGVLTWRLYGRGSHVGMRYERLRSVRERTLSGRSESGRTPAKHA